MIAADALEGLPLARRDEVASLAPILVIAPHPDDETLGAGGLIALLRDHDRRVEVVLVSDGAASHPNSRAFPPQRLAELRRRELDAALRILGVDPARHLHALGCPDGAVPARGAAGFEGAAGGLRQLVRALDPRTALVPWRRDPHADHRATFEIAEDALKGSKVRSLEYPIWLRVRGAPEDWPEPDERRGFRIAVGSVMERKRQAVAAHVSQTTPLINDADETFCLSEDVQARLIRPHEVFLEPA